MWCMQGPDGRVLTWRVRSIENGLQGVYVCVVCGAGNGVGIMAWSGNGSTSVWLVSVRGQE